MAAQVRSDELVILYLQKSRPSDRALHEDARCHAYFLELFLAYGLQSRSALDDGIGVAQTDARLNNLMFSPVFLIMSLISVLSSNSFIYLIFILQ